jgi:hypothetical protein
MRSTRCLASMQNPSRSIALSSCSARYHEQVRPRVPFSLMGRPSRDRTTAAAVPFVMPSTDLVRDEDSTPRPMWMTPPDDVTCVLDPQPAATVMQSTTKRTAARFTPGYIRHRAPQESHAARGSFRNTGPGERPCVRRVRLMPGRCVRRGLFGTKRRGHRATPGLDSSGAKGRIRL